MREQKTKCCGNCEHYATRKEFDGYCKVIVPFWASELATERAIRYGNYGLKPEQGADCKCFTTAPTGESEAGR